MNRIVKKHYPVERLPEDLRTGIAIDARVTVTVEPEETSSWSTMILEEIFEQTKSCRTGSDDAVERVRALRDEWGERDEHLESIRRKLKE
jgi:hypothetical protein